MCHVSRHVGASHALGFPPPTRCESVVGRKKLERAWDGGDSLNPLPEGALWCMPGLVGGVARACEYM